MIEEYTKYINKNGHCRLPEGFKEIEDGAFKDCEKLESITIPNSIKSIGKKAFEYCENLTSIEIPNSVISIGEDAFCGCKNLTSITIPDSITEINKGAFFGCSNLTSITIPNSVESISWGAFYGCYSLISIDIPNGVTSIDNEAFKKCTNLKLIIIPNSVAIIGTRAFEYCESLTSITIPNSVEYIGECAFNGCENLTSITIFGKNKNIDLVKSLMIPAMCRVKIIQEEAKPLTELSKQIHENAVKHGWWERKVDFPIIVALCHAELSEALEEYRSGNPNFYFISNGFKSEDIDEIGEEKPEGIAVEMIDCVIRILDWCGQNGIDVDRLVEIKNEYNKTRPYKHGGKVC